MEPYINRNAVERLVSEHSVGRRDHSAVLWRLIVLEYWLAAFTDGRLGRPPLAPFADITGTRARAARGAHGVKSAPAAVSQLFLHSDSTAPRLRVGLLVDEGGIPAYARGVIEDFAARTTWTSHSSAYGRGRSQSGVT